MSSFFTYNSFGVVFLPLILLFFGIQFIFASQPHCPHAVSEEIQRCIQPVAEYAKVLNKHDNSSSSSPADFGQAIQLPRLGRQVFKELCGLIRDFEVCVEQHKEQCSRHITINLIEASYGYLCNEGYETFMNSAECLMELDQRPSVKKCHDDTLREIERANNEAGISMASKLDRMCDALNFFSGCVRRPIRHSCGTESWQVIFRVLKDTTKTLMPACQFTGRAHPHRTSESEEEEEAQTTTSTSRPKTRTTPDWLIPKVTMNLKDPPNGMENILAVVEEEEEEEPGAYEVEGGFSGISRPYERRKFAQIEQRKGNSRPNGSTPQLQGLAYSLMAMLSCLALSVNLILV